MQAINVALVFSHFLYKCEMSQASKERVENELSQTDVSFAAKHLVAVSQEEEDTDRTKEGPALVQ